MPKLNRVLETVLYVADLERAAAFYASVLGLPCIHSDHRMRAFDVGGNGVLLLFPEGTNMSRNARATSQKWSKKSGIPDLKHVLLPRSRGLQCCLKGLSGSAEWLYDCTVAYDGIRQRMSLSQSSTTRLILLQTR